ncbi:MAG: hypothetical protein A3C38_06330 [Planctomycetes bacterium RIFCSPHIGHO2_02_FULL_50_42]|nr:MAG: hypothetical protein A2060_01335 [Planctomycetes bacterium GWA2_50_13]OHB88325.1 MAG: hypothetical protein A3C38_06330 [Planctomycetes bacterium RIFCSPHIGHO2_02_FULL_50_42]OHB95702.1 MAG: hypothetical protein A3I59_06725 [Planctomycetes bacterium RIFCSPLOWO2_02_FULL_50_16]OHC02974.1 MAG: hypothetical protein A3G17_07595 [Planctomycetes bacterium RIFCSPLOWO2_12_FULL_50_35]HCN19095.1 hypothetical protein [Planctomycetia bacterium]
MTPALLEREVCETPVLEERLQAFCDAVNAHDYLEIDGVIYAGQEFAGKKFEKDALKIDNHRMKTSYTINPEAILKQELDVVIGSLETGVREKLYGITRIVGYYSRTSNWNKSKIGELRDRHRGDYSVRKVA